MRYTLTHRVQKLPVQHSQCASKSVRRPENHVVIVTCKAALPASSKFTLTVPSNLFVTNFHLHSFLFYLLACDSDIGIDVYSFEFTERKPKPEKVSTVAAS